MESTAACVLSLVWYVAMGLLLLFTDNGVVDRVLHSVAPGDMSDVLLLLVRYEIE
jgi:hypothetical protein